MLAYAANRPVVVDRRPRPNAMLFIVGAHVAVAAAVMSAKMQIPVPPREPPIIVDSFKTPPPPAPKPTQTPPVPHPPTWISNPPTRVDLPPVNPPPATSTGPKIDPGPVLGAGTSNIPAVTRPVITPIKSGAQLLTPASDLKPPYPPSKLLNEEEASLTLRLTIDQNGRVTAVDPVGRTDPVFLAAARRHLIARWRYKPAMEDGQPVASSAVITLRFQLDG